jgi:hypothetical protein
MGDASTRTLYDIKQVHPGHIIEILEGQAAGNTASLERSLEIFNNRVDRYFGAKNESRQSVTLHRADAKGIKNLQNFNLQEHGVLLVLLPNVNPLQFAKAKLWADCEQGISTVCALQKRSVPCLPHFEQGAMKINHHAGGKKYIVKNEGLDSKKSIVLGISVSHPAHNSKAHSTDCPFVAAVVASSDDDFLEFQDPCAFNLAAVR